MNFVCSHGFDLYRIFFLWIYATKHIVFVLFRTRNENDPELTLKRLSVTCSVLRIIGESRERERDRERKKKNVCCKSTAV